MIFFNSGLYDLTTFYRCWKKNIKLCGCFTESKGTRKLIVSRLGTRSGSLYFIPGAQPVLFCNIHWFVDLSICALVSNLKQCNVASTLSLRHREGLEGLREGELLKFSRTAMSRCAPNTNPPPACWDIQLHYTTFVHMCTCHVVNVHLTLTNPNNQPNHPLACC